ncbi:MAG: hypothetical protein JKY52_03700 [Flavobacteriales bacterium]|nr:hypothetical protein [Flavobacteriales bacterium]
MPVEVLEIRKQLIIKAIKRFGDEGDVAHLVSWLVDNGVLEERHIIRYLIKAEYQKRTRYNDVNRLKVKLDLAVEYDVSLPTVNNIIYRYHNIIP